MIRFIVIAYTFLFVGFLHAIQPCVDLAAPGRLSDCPRYAVYCKVPQYELLMKMQCPRTCGYCPVPSLTTTARPSRCVDLAQPGRLSTCPGQRVYCTHPAYVALMKQQCPKTCGYCV